MAADTNTFAVDNHANPISGHADFALPVSPRLPTASLHPRPTMSLQIAWPSTHELGGKSTPTQTVASYQATRQSDPKTSQPTAHPQRTGDEAHPTPPQSASTHAKPPTDQSANDQAKHSCRKVTLTRRFSQGLIPRAAGDKLWLAKKRTFLRLPSRENHLTPLITFQSDTKVARKWHAMGKMMGNGPQKAIRHPRKGA
jgi:hypothetical protein